VEQVSTPSAVTADLHVHTGSSSDSYVPDLPRYQSLVAADLDVVVISDHNRITDPAAALDAARADGPGMHGIAGVEARIGPRTNIDGEKIGSLGHANFYPLVAEAPLPPNDSLEFAEHIDLFRERQRRHPHPHTGERVVVQLNHPRGLSFDPDDRRPRTSGHPLLNSYRFDREAPLEGTRLTQPQPKTGTTALDFDVLEVLNRFSWEPYREVRADWFSFMNSGLFHTGVGNSDSHALAVELAGFPVNFVRVASETRADGTFDTSSFVDALLGGHVTVSTGPIVDLRVTAANGDSAGAGPGEILSAPDGRVRATVEVLAASWVPVHELRLIVDGSSIAPLQLTDALSTDGKPLHIAKTWEVVLERDGWILAEAGWPIDDPPTRSAAVLGEYARVAPGYIPMAFTNPVRVAVDRR
jgi:hypothetical protein